MVKVVVVLALASTAARAGPNATEAEKLTRTARTAARGGRCGAVRTLGKRVHALDAAHYEQAFKPDPFIAGCREGVAFGEPEPPPLPLATLSLAAVIGHASGEWADATAAGSAGVASPAASPGFRAEVGLRIAPHVSLHGFFRYIRVRYDVSTGPDYTDVATYDLGAGVRYTRGIAGPLDGFVQGDVAYSSVSVDGSFGGTNQSFAPYLESDFGVGARVGGAYAVSPLVTLTVAAGYTSATIDGFDNAWLTLEGGVQIGAFR